jgi:hypothetical protein
MAIIVLILLLLSGVSLASRSFLQQTQPPGVVVTPSVAVSDGPRQQARQPNFPYPNGRRSLCLISKGIGSDSTSPVAEKAGYRPKPPNRLRRPQRLFLFCPINSLIQITPL